MNMHPAPRRFTPASTMASLAALAALAGLVGCASVEPPKPQASPRVVERDLGDERVADRLSDKAAPRPVR
jgi:hypothetical protein